MEQRLRLRIRSSVCVLINARNWEDEFKAITLSNFDDFIPDNDADAGRILQDIGILPHQTDGPPCPKCGHPKMGMEIARKDHTLGFIFSCRKNYFGAHRRCEKKVSPLKGTIFEGTRLKPNQLLKLMYCFSNSYDVSLAAKEIKVERLTAISWYKKFREICARVCLNEDHKIGGPNTWVEIDESKIAKRKYHKGRALKGEKVWCFGGICRESREGFAVMVRKRDRPTLMNLLSRYVREGTTIVTDDWRAYRGLQNFGFREHHVVIHKYNFVNPCDRRVHTNTVERQWRDIKSFLPTRRHQYLKMYLAHYFYEQRKFKTPFNPETPARDRKTFSPGSDSSEESTAASNSAAICTGLVAGSTALVGLNAVTNRGRPNHRRQTRPARGHRAVGVGRVQRNTLPNNATGNATTPPTMPMPTNAVHQPVLQNAPAPPGLSAPADALNASCHALLRHLLRNDCYRHVNNIDIVLRNNMNIVNNAIQAMRQPIHAFNQQDSYHRANDKLNDNDMHAAFNAQFALMRTRGGGDCFYASVSWNVFGTDRYHVVARVAALSVAVRYQTDIQPAQEQYHGTSYLDLLLAIGTPADLINEATNFYPQASNNDFNWGSGTSHDVSLGGRCSLLQYSLNQRSVLSEARGARPIRCFTAGGGGGGG
ncbi:hypothetical protein B566_EDAN007704 [Ephemera danica]|nr:hypothetical protein B566_EDAN007704 [Ephemera danica]